MWHLTEAPKVLGGDVGSIAPKPNLCYLPQQVPGRGMDGTHVWCYFQHPVLQNVYFGNGHGLTTNKHTPRPPVPDSGNAAGNKAAGLTHSAETKLQIRLRCLLLPNPWLDVFDGSIAAFKRRLSLPKILKGVSCPSRNSWIPCLILWVHGLVTRLPWTTAESTLGACGAFGLAAFSL